MKTTEIDGKKYTASTQDDGSIVLTPIDGAAPERVARCGDVHLNSEGTGFCLCTGVSCPTWYFSDFVGQLIDTQKPDYPLLLNIQDFARGDYVLKSDVVAALSFKDNCGDSVLKGSECVYEGGIKPTREALAALGITSDA